MTVKELAGLIDDLAPQVLAADWDNVGLQIGDPSATVRGVVFALDLTDAAVDEAIAKNVNVLCVHHPAIYRPLSKLLANDPVGSLIRRVVSLDISVIVAHTNLDSAVGGVNDALAAALGLTDTAPLLPSTEKVYKLVVFTPHDSVSPVLSALADQGCGVIGEYSSCSFRSSGTGAFVPSAAAHPAVGEKEQLNEVEEVRLEVIVPEARLKGAVAAMTAAHPYEEVAYDLYTLERPPGVSGASGEHGSGAGLGRIADLAEARVVSGLVDEWSRRLGVPAARVSGDTERAIRRIALCGGSASSVVAAAAHAGAGALVGGEFSYHDSAAADHHGMNLIALGHDITEQVVLAPWRKAVDAHLSDRGVDIPTVLSQAPASSWKWHVAT